MSDLKSSTSRLNGAKSQGPVTASGKARASQNAIKLGIFSKRTILADENPADFEQLLVALVEELEPVGVLEAYHVDEVAKGIWRKQRLYRAETAAIEKSRLAFQFATTERKWDEVAPRLSLRVESIQPVARAKLEGIRDDVETRLRSVPLEDQRFSRVAAALDKSIERSLRMLREAQSDRRRRTDSVIVASDGSQIPRLGSATITESALIAPDGLVIESGGGDRAD